MKCRYCYNEFYEETQIYMTCNKCQHIISNYKPYHHNYKPEFEFEFDRETNLHIGFELEIEFPNVVDLHRFIIAFVNNKLDKYFYLKNDATLSFNGIEIVSKPLVFDMYYNIQEIKTLFNIIIKFRGSNDNNCGLHFHLDRKYFQPINISVMDMLINNNQSLIEIIAERKMNRYCRIKRKNYEAWGLHSPYDNRYNAVNLINSNTVELRFFKSQIKYNKFIEKINFLKGFIDFCKQFNSISDAMYYSYNTDFNNKIIQMQKK